MSVSKARVACFGKGEMLTGPERSGDAGTRPPPAAGRVACLLRCRAAGQQGAMDIWSAS
jgi:hypothetical protein